MTRRFTVQGTNNAFECQHCKATVYALQNGSVRNHCPVCLHSLHVDVFPGDRACECKGLMRPVGVEQHSKKGWMIVHQCKKCGYIGKNRAALDDPQQPDDWDQLVTLSTQRL